MNYYREKRRFKAVVLSIVAMSVGLTSCQISPLSEKKASREARNLAPDQLDNGCYIRQGDESPDQYELRNYYTQRYSRYRPKVTDPLPYWCVESVYTQKEIETWAEKGDSVAIYTNVFIVYNKQEYVKLGLCDSLLSELKVLADVKFTNFKGDYVYRIPETYFLIHRYTGECRSGGNGDDDSSLLEGRRRGYEGSSLDGSISANE